MRPGSRFFSLRECTPVLFWFAVLLSARTSKCSPAADLAALQAKANGGFISLDDKLYSQAHKDLMKGTFSLLLFFDASDHEQMPREAIAPLLEEFNVASKSYEAARDKSTNEGPERVFFGVMDFPDSEKTFRLLEVQNLPHIKFLSNRHGKKGVECKYEQWEGKAEGLFKFLQTVGVKVGAIKRPRSVVELLGVPLAILGSVVFLLGAWKTVSLTKRGLHMPLQSLLGCALSLLVYTVSISGFMYTIINKMPMYYWSGNKLTMVFQGEEQLGLEGFGAGLLYTSAGASLAFLVNVAPLVKSSFVQRLVSYFCQATCMICVFVLFYFQQWKRGR